MLETLHCDRSNTLKSESGGRRQAAAHADISSMASVKDNTIKVVARFRPQNKVEIASGGEPIVGFDSEDTCRLDSKEAQGAFTFDRVFGMDSRQVDVFDYSIRSTVDDILNGYNGTVLAYGQTGAGK